mgnify:CR=1 FL=1
MDMYSAITLMVVMAMVIMELFTLTSSTLESRKRSNFIALFFVISVCAVCEWSGMLLQNNYPELIWVHIFVKALELSAAPFIGVFIGRLVNGSSFDVPVIVLMGVNVVLEIMSSRLGFIFYVDLNNVYHHGNCYWIYVASYSLSVAYVLFCGAKGMKKYQYNGGGFLAMLGLFFATAVFIQLNLPNVKVDWFVTAYCAVFLYIFNAEMIQQTDPVTGLLNRRGYEAYLLNIRGRAAIIFFDVDSFKSTNDKYGHGFGDTTLNVVASVIRECYGKSGKCFRIGGDEFCVIVNDSIDGIDSINEKFLAKIEEKVKFDARLPYVSLGYSIFDGENDVISDAILHADKNMYRFKEEHKIEE